LKAVEPLVDEFEAGLPFRLDSFQREAIDKLDRGRGGVLVSAPTSSGKTVIADYAIFRALREGSKVLYTTPLKALSNQKYHDFVREHGEATVGLVTGENTINDEAPVVVMTTEILRNLIYEDPGRLDLVRYVVLDEVHYIDDYPRGTVWEEVIVQAPQHIRFIGLSATISNVAEVGPDEIVQFFAGRHPRYPGAGAANFLGFSPADILETMDTVALDEAGDRFGDGAHVMVLMSWGSCQPLSHPREQPGQRRAHHGERHGRRQVQGVHRSTGELGEGDGILPSLTCALRHVERHRMCCVAGERDSALPPARDRRAVVDVRLVDFVFLHPGDQLGRFARPVAESREQRLLSRTVRKSRNRPAPTETILRFSGPWAHLIPYWGNVVTSRSKSEGLLYGVSAPSTNKPGSAFSTICKTSGSK